MSELQPPTPPNSSLLDKPWKPVISEHMKKGDNFVIDASYDAFPVSEIGLERGHDVNVAVIGKVSNSDKNFEQAEESGISFAVVRIDEQNGSETYHIVTDKLQEDGSVKKSWMSIPKNVKLTIGRGDESTRDDPTFIDGQRLSGKNLSNGISRKHMTLELTNQGIEVTDLSTNGTHIEAVKAQTDHRTAASGVLHAGEIQVQEVPIETGNNKLIDGAPKTPEDFAKLEAARLEELNKHKTEQLAKIEEEFDAFRSNFTEDQTLNMWKYAAGLMNKREAQIKGDGQASYDHERMAGEGLSALKTPELKAAADKYHGYMQQISYLRSSL